MTVMVEKNGPVTTIVMRRPVVKNTVDPTEARALYRAFPAKAETAFVRSMPLRKHLIHPPLRSIPNSSN